MKKLVVLLLLLVQFNSYSQDDSFNEKPPVFPNCESAVIDSVQQCFDNHIFKSIYKEFKVPQKAIDENYKGEVVILFEVDADGIFRVIYVDAMYSELKDEAKRVFGLFPKIKPATYNGRATFKQYSIAVKIPLVDQTTKTQDLAKENEISKLEQQAKKEFDSVNANLMAFENKAYSSQLNIPFIHSEYAKFDRNMSLIGTNSHTASKPFIYEEVATYYDFEAQKEKLLKKDTITWVSKKLME